MYFADHLNSLLFIVFCPFSFTLSLVPIVSFCFYLILMSKRMHLIHKFAVLKGDSSPKLFSFFVFYFIVSKKIFFIPPQLSNFQEFSNQHPRTLIPRLLSFEEFSNSPIYSNHLPPFPLLLGTQEYVRSSR